MRLSTRLYRAARLSNDIEAITSGDSKRVERRLRNKLKGRLLARLGVWRWLWK